MAYASRHSSYILSSVGLAVQVLAFELDTYSHLFLGKAEPWWNSEHLVFYCGFSLVFLAVWRGLRMTRRGTLLMAPIRFVNTAGLRIAGLGLMIEIISCAWFEISHTLSSNELFIASAFALVTFGILTLGFGIVLGLSIENGLIKHQILIVPRRKRWAITLCLTLTFASIWLAASGSLIYLAHVLSGEGWAWITAMPLAILATLILVPVKRVLPEFGSATSIGIVSNLVEIVLLVGCVGLPTYVPWSLIPLVSFDALELLIRRSIGLRRTVLVSSIIVSALFYATYYPFSLFFFSWASSLNLRVALTVACGIVGAWFGERVYSQLSAAVLQRVA